MSGLGGFFQLGDSASKQAMLRQHSSLAPKFDPSRQRNNNNNNNNNNIDPRPATAPQNQNSSAPSTARNIHSDLVNNTPKNDHFNYSNHYQQQQQQSSSNNNQHHQQQEQEGGNVGLFKTFKLESPPKPMMIVIPPTQSPAAMMNNSQQQPLGSPMSDLNQSYSNYPLKGSFGTAGGAGTSFTGEHHQQQQLPTPPKVPLNFNDPASFTELPTPRSAAAGRQTSFAAQAAADAVANANAHNNNQHQQQQEPPIPKNLTLLGAPTSSSNARRNSSVLSPSSNKASRDSFNTYGSGSASPMSSASASPLSTSGGGLGNTHTSFKKAASATKTGLSLRNRAAELQAQKLLHTLIDSAAEPDAISEDPIFRLWMRQHPQADGMLVAAQKHRRMKEIADAERTERVHNLKRLQEDLSRLESLDEMAKCEKEQLDKLISPSRDNLSKMFGSKTTAAPTAQQEHQNASNNNNNATTASGGGGGSQTGSSAASPSVSDLGGDFVFGGRKKEQQQEKIDAENKNQQQQEQQQQQTSSSSSHQSKQVLDVLHLTEVEQQRLAWISFAGLLDDAVAQKTGISSADEKQTIAHVVSAPAEHGELALRGWEDEKGVWHASTDRYETAATAIQCAFRCFIARSRADEKRRTRISTLRKIVAQEAALEYAWLAATSVRTSSGEALQASEVDRTIRVMSIFAERFHAVVERRRKKIQREKETELETRDYAVRRIQACVRGFLVRCRVRDIRHPEIAQAKQAAIENEAATNIQRMLRGRLARVRTWKRRAAATRIQAMYRRHLCLYRAAQQRRAKRVSADAELADYASRIVQRFMRSLVVRRRRGLRQFRAQAILLQSVGRGYLERRKGSLLFNDMVEEAAIDIQRMFRGWYARNQYVSGLVTAHKNAMEEALQQHAACIVTRAFRRAKIFADQRMQLLKTVAATEIQRIFRGHAARAHYKDLLEKENKELLLQKQENSALLVQSLFRGFEARKKYRYSFSPPIHAMKTKKEQQQQHERKKHPLALQQEKLKQEQEREARLGGVETSSTTRKKEEILAELNSKFPSNEVNNNAASKIQHRFYKPFVRKRLFYSKFIHPKARCVSRFMRLVHFRKLKLEKKKVRTEQIIPAMLQQSVQEEQNFAAGQIQRFLRLQLNKQKGALDPLFQQKCKQRKSRLEILLQISQDQEMDYRVITIQRYVRGYLVRRYLSVVHAIRDAKKRKDKAELQAEESKSPSRAPPEGVSSYEAACALQRYYVKHTQKDTEEVKVAKDTASSSSSPQKQEEQEEEKQEEQKREEEKPTEEEKLKEDNVVDPNANKPDDEINEL